MGQKSAPWAVGFGLPNKMALKQWKKKSSKSCSESSSFIFLLKKNRTLNLYEVYESARNRSLCWGIGQRESSCASLHALC